MYFCLLHLNDAQVLNPKSDDHLDYADADYKDLSTKVSSKLLTSAETAAESKDALASINWAAPKAKGLSIEEMAKRIDAGLRSECWFVTGRSLPELFSDSFSFSDPQVRSHCRTTGLKHIRFMQDA